MYLLYSLLFPKGNFFQGTQIWFDFSLVNSPRNVPEMAEDQPPETEGMSCSEIGLWSQTTQGVNSDSQGYDEVVEGRYVTAAALISSVKRGKQGYLSCFEK